MSGKNIMEFDKKKYSNKNRINFSKNMSFVTGSGGSRNLIYIGDKYVYKIIPNFKKGENDRVKLNHDQNEIKVYKLLTQLFVLKNKTPHIVGYYDNYKTDITKIILAKCPSIKDQLTVKKLKFNNLVCRLKEDYNAGYINKTADVIVLEKCPLNITSYLENILNSKSRTKYETLKENIDIISFQIIYSLACIQKSFPNFVHNDFFLRNIIGIEETEYDVNDYIEYIYKNKKFYLPANGFCAKINDFGFALAPNTIKSTELMFVNEKRTERMPQIDCKKCDIFNFFHDFYDGHNLGAKSCMALLRKKSKKKQGMIRNVFKKYIDVKVIDKANSVNRQKLNWISMAEK